MGFQKIRNVAQLLFSRKARKGHAVVETALVAPWIFFLFVGVLDFGFYAYALIAVENAARVAALSAGIGDTYAVNQTIACGLVVDELSRMPNVKTLPAGYGCGAAPLQVNINTNPGYVDAEGNPATWVRVRYETVQLIPIPGILMGKATIDRRVETRIYGG